MFFLAFVLGAIASFSIHAGQKIKVSKPTHPVEVPGNYTTLILFLSFFAVRYYFGTLKSTHPELALKYLVSETVIVGLFSGYFIGRALRYTHSYLKA